MLDESAVVNQDLVRALQTVVANTSFASFLGAQILKASPGSVELAIDVRPDIMNQHHGFVHGAVMGFVADSACAWAAGTVAGDVVTAEYKLHFLAPAVGQRVIGRGKVIKASSRIVVTQADIYCVNKGLEKLVAISLATIVKVQRESPIGGRGDV